MLDLIFTGVDTMTVFDCSTGAYKFTLDELQNVTIANGQESSDVVGARGRKLSTLKRNKTCTVSGASSIVSGGLLEAQTGGTASNTTTKVMWTDYLTVSSGAAATSYKAVGTAGAEIIALYIRNSDGSLGTKLTQDSTAAAGKFTYAPGTKALGFYSDVADKTDIVVVYERQILADVLANDTTKFSAKATVYVDGTAEDKCGNVYRVQFYFPKVDFSGEFSLEMGDDQTVHNFEAEALAGACGLGGNLWTYTVFGANTADAA